MKIVVVTARFPISQGEEFLASEIVTLGATGVEVVIHPTRSRSSELRSIQLAGRYQTTGVASIGLWRALRALANMVRHPFTTYSLVRTLLASPRHLTRNLAALPNAMLLGAWCRAHKVDHIHAHWLSTSATTAYIASRISGVPYSITAHRGDIVDANLVDVKARSAQFLRFISRSGIDLFRQTTGFEPRNWFVLPMGVDVPDDRDERPVTSSRVVRVVIPASLLPVKGHQYVFEAIATLQQSRDTFAVDVIGDGPLREQLEHQVLRLGIGGIVSFLGHVPHQHLMQRYADSMYDIVALGSVDLGEGLHEGIPVALMEAMAHGVTPIATRSGGIAELIIPEVSGVLVAPSDSEEFGSALARLLADPDLRRRLGEAARLRIAESFSAEIVARKLLHQVSASGSSKAGPRK